MAGVTVLAVGVCLGFYGGPSVGPGAVFWTAISFAALAVSCSGVTPASHADVRSVCSLLALGLVFGYVGALGSVERARLGLAPATVTEISGTLLWDSSRAGSKTVYDLRLFSAAGLAGEVSASGRVRVYVSDGPRAYWGERVVISRVQDFDSTRVFGDQIAVSPASSKALRIRADAHRRLSDRLATLSSDSGAALFAALVVGVRDDLDPTLVEFFRRSGCSHVLALSGMHLGLFCAVPALVLRRWIGPRKAAGATLAFATFFVFFAGLKPSLLRALTLYGIATVTFVTDKRRSSVSLLGLSFLILIFVAPSMGRALSFQLSFLALLGIFVVAPPLGRLWSKWLPPTIATATSAAVSAQIATAGAVGASFGVIYPAGIIASLVVMPAVILHLIWGLAAVFLSFFGLSGPAGMVWDRTHDLVLAVVRLFARGPGIRTSGVLPWIIAVVLVCMFGSRELFRFRWRVR